MKSLICLSRLSQQADAGRQSQQIVGERRHVPEDQEKQGEQSRAGHEGDRDPAGIGALQNSQAEGKEAHQGESQGK